MNKICVYTCITGNYDRLKEIKYREKNIDYICFTNNKEIKSNDWNIKYIDEDLDNLTLARKLKILGHQYLKEYNINVWIDGAIEILKPISEFLKDCCDFNRYDIIGFNHKFRNCIYDEMKECVQVNKETVENALKLEKFLIKEKYPKNNGLIESTVLVRKNIDEINKLMDDWYNMLIKFSRRDQLSFNYCLWKRPVKISFLNMYVYDNPYFKHDQHLYKKVIKKYQLYIGNSTEFDIHNCIEGKYSINELKQGLKIKIPKDTNRIELKLDEVGNIIKSVKLNKRSKIFIYNSCDFKKNKIFYDLSVISFEGKFLTGDELEFRIDIEELDNINKYKLLCEEYIELEKKNDVLNNKYNALKKSYSELLNNYDIVKKDNENISKSNEELNNEIKRIINSKSWKITKPLRMIRKGK